MLLRLFRHTFLACSVACAGGALAADDAVWINAEIRAAIARGDKAYRLPAGTFELESTIVIPPGTRNFALIGAGSDQTILRTPSVKLSHAVRVGFVPVLFNNWGIANRRQIPVMTVSEGSNRIQLPRTSPAVEPGLYVLWDEHRIQGVKPPYNSVLNRAEIVRVASFDEATWQARLDAPVGREYTVSPKLADVRDAVCENIEVSGLQLQGSLGDTATNGIVSAGLTEGLVLADLKVRGYWSDAVTVNTVRNARLERLDVEGAVGSGAGAGYGVSIYRSRFVVVRGSRAHNFNPNSGFIVHSGSTDVVIRDSVCEESAKFDTHGYDDRRILFENCSGGTMGIGNVAWLGGARHVALRNCTHASIWIGPNVVGVRATDSRFGRVTLASVPPQENGNPRSGRPDAIAFVNCDIVGSGTTILSDSSDGGWVTFLYCRIANTRTDWGHVALLEKYNGQMAFYNCEIRTANSRTPILLASPKPSMRLILRNCVVSSERNAAQAVSVDPAFEGTYEMVGNLFRSYAPRGFHSDVQTRSGCLVQNNRVETLSR
ncbi:MAG: hypothetical protein N2109_06790 [Fimbriimonadales bacterium]|nr:hypothetical protein [Fimbriimonadales bacterium]